MSLKVLSGGVERGVLVLLSRSGDEHLVPRHVAGGGVVAGVRDSPRVVGDTEGRVEDPSDGVVNCLRIGKGDDVRMGGVDDMEKEGDEADLGVGETLCAARR